MERVLNELNQEFFGGVVHIWEDGNYHYFIRTYVDGKQDDIKVSKRDGSMFWKPVEDEEWEYNFKVAV